MNLEEYKRLYGDKEDAAPGWDAIESQLKSVYTDQVPMHYGTELKHCLGGPDPIDGISVYECKDGGIDHLHFITYGYSSLYYDEKAFGGDFSNFGFEMTFRLASQLPAQDQPTWVIDLLQNLARYVFKSSKWFEEYHWIPANGPIRADFETDIVGLAFLKDPRLSPIDTHHGRVEFIQAFGITQIEIDAIKSKTHNVREIIEMNKAINPLLITDLKRKSI